MVGKRVLFVDDEQNVLRGLQRMLRSKRGEWDMAFASGGQEALALLEKQHFDVIVSDVYMPVMDGPQLLNQIKHRYPDMIRIVLSSCADQEMFMSSLGVTHQYFSKPCDAETLKAAVERAFSLKNLFEKDPSFHSSIARLHTLPSLPSLYQEITEELNSPNASINRVSQIMAQDPAMTAKILQLVNSAFPGRSHSISSLEQAVSLLGLGMIRTLVLSANLSKQFDEQWIPETDLDRFWQHSYRIGKIAKDIAIREGAGTQVSGEAMTIGVLHDIGQLILLANFPTDYRRLIEMAWRENVDVSELERSHFGTSHAEIGAYLLGLWGLSDTIVQGVANHHYPEKVLTQGFSAAVAVYLADVRIHTLRGRNLGRTEIEHGLLERFGRSVSQMEHSFRQCLSDESLQFLLNEELSYELCPLK